MKGQRGLTATLGDAFTDTLTKFGGSGVIDTTGVNTEIDKLAAKAQKDAADAAAKAQQEIANAAAKATEKIDTSHQTLLEKTKKALSNANHPGIDENSYTSPVAVLVGLAAGGATAYGVYKSRAKHGKVGIFVPAIAGLVVDSIAHFSTAQIIDHQKKVGM